MNKAILVFLCGSALTASVAFAADKPVVTERECKSVTEVCVEQEEVVASYGFLDGYSGAYYQARGQAETHAKKIGGRFAEDRFHNCFNVIGKVKRCSLRCN